MSYTILVLDDDKRIEKDLNWALKPKFSMIFKESFKKFKALDKKLRVDLILLDINFGDKNGFDVVQEIKKKFPKIPVLILTGSRSSYNLNNALNSDVQDYLYKGKDLDSPQELQTKLSKYIRINNQLQNEARQNEISYPTFLSVNKIPENFDLIGDSQEIKKVKIALNIAAMNPNFSVLIVGETGVGKGHAAKLLLQYRNKQKGTDSQIAFQEISVFDVLENDFKTLLFGETEKKPKSNNGLFDYPEDSLVLFDEISDWDQQHQLLLLRLFDTKKEMDHNAHRFKPQIVATTSLPISKNDGFSISEPEKVVSKLRKELINRFDFIINIPPLRERGRDIGLLFKHFLGHDLYQKLDKEVRNHLNYYEWPGNINELFSTSEYIKLLYGLRRENGKIDIDCIPPYIRQYYLKKHHRVIKTHPKIRILSDPKDKRCQEEILKILESIKQNFSEIEMVGYAINISQMEDLEQLRKQLIHESNVWIVLVSSHLNQSNINEVERVEREKEEKVIIPIVIADIDMPEALSKYISLGSIEFDYNNEAHWSEIKDDLREKLESIYQPA